MKINSIHSENFKGYERKSLDLRDKIQIYIGKNGSGKTSALEMIKYVITGEEPDGSVNQAYNYMSVEAILDSGTTFERGRNLGKSKIKVNGKTSTGKMLNDLIENETHISTGTMKIVSSSEVIENMKPDQFGDFLMKYIPEELDSKTIIDFAECKEPVIESTLTTLFPLMPTKFGMESVSTAYEEASETKKRCRALMNERKNNLKMFESVISKRSLSEIEKDIENLNKEEGMLAASVNAAKIYKTSVETLEKQEHEIRLLKEEIAKISVSRPSESLRESLLKERNDITEEILTDKQILDRLKQSKKMYEDQLKNLDCEICPLCDEIKCTTDMKVYKDTFKEHLDSTIEGIEIQTEKINKHQKKYEEILEKINEYSEKVNLYNKKILLTKHLDQLEATKVKLPEKPKGTSTIRDFKSEREILQKEKENELNVLKKEKLEQEYEQYKTLYEQYSKVCDLLSPKGIVMAKIISYYLNAFEDICNEKAMEIDPEFRIKLYAENGVKISCKKTKKSDFIPYDFLSSGEKQLVMFLIMDMLNSLSGLNILIMDDLDRLDKDAFEALIKIIADKKVSDHYDHILLCAVDHEDTLNILSKYPEIKINKF